MDFLARATEPWASIGYIAILGVMVVLQEAVVRHLSAPEHLDPRLGAVAFWLWVCITALATYILWPVIDNSTWAERIITVTYCVAWVAWKTGLLRGLQERAREHEEIWATTVGVSVAALLR